MDTSAIRPQQPQRHRRRFGAVRRPARRKLTGIYALVEEMEERWANIDAAVVGVMAAGLEAVKNKCRANIENLPEGDESDDEDLDTESDDAAG